MWASTEGVSIILTNAKGRVKPDRVTVVGILNVCASVGALKEGQHVHEQIIQCGLQSNPNASSSLVDMYSECGSLEDAMTVLQNAPTQCGCLECSDLRPCEMWARDEGIIIVSGNATEKGGAEP